MSINSTDLDVLQMFKERSGGIGIINGPYPPRGFGVKHFWEWRVVGTKAVKLARDMQPFLGERRSRTIDEKIARWETRPKRKIKVSDKTRKKIWVERAEGRTYQSIADQHGISLPRVYQITKMYTKSDRAAAERLGLV